VDYIKKQGVVEMFNIDADSVEKYFKACRAICNAIDPPPHTLVLKVY
jgi:hypothetical protein